MLKNFSNQEVGGVCAHILGNTATPLLMPGGQALGSPGYQWTEKLKNAFSPSNTRDNVTSAYECIIILRKKMSIRRLVHRPIKAWSSKSLYALCKCLCIRLNKVQAGISAAVVPSKTETTLSQYRYIIATDSKAARPGHAVELIRSSLSKLSQMS
jgi:hypothetical protein